MCKIKNEESTILEIEDGSFWYDGEVLPVWEHLFAKFYPGKIHGIIGPSGCGKSSVLCFINGLIPFLIEGQAQGKVWFKGQDISNERPVNRCKQIGYVMQHPESQFCTFTVEEELAFGMENLGYPKDVMIQKIKEVLELVGMSGFEHTDLNHLSGGQKQKIAIASILVMDPEVLLLDEPTANLDPKSRKEIFDLIVQLSKECGKTILLVEHHIHEIIQSVDVLYEMDRSGNLERVSNEAQPPKIRTIPKRTDNLQPSEDLILDVKNISFCYDKKGNGKKILNDLSLSIPKGDFLAIIGENGAGKSTLMKVLFQICKEDGGQICFHQKPIGQYRKRNLYQRMGLVFQNPESQFVKNTVYEEMAFSLKKSHLTKEEAHNKIMSMLKRFHLEDFTERSPFVLSLGQKRRLSVAIMLLTNQEILFLDEPTYGQDFENRMELMSDLQKLNDQGITIVMITHDMSIVEAYAKRVALLEQGTIIRVYDQKRGQM